MKKYFTIYLVLASVLVMSFDSCNKKDNDKDSEVIDQYNVYSSASTLVSDFSLNDNSQILENLSEVNFTIDQDRCLIYNVDSLPKGTKVNQLTVNLVCASSVSSRQFIVKNGTTQRDTTINYVNSSTCYIDFTGDVTLRITSFDGNHERNYKVKVNVHKQNPDTITWDLSNRRDLPNINGNLYSSKTVAQNNKFLCLIHDNSGYALNINDNKLTSSWQKKNLLLPFNPQIESFTASSSELFMLDVNGELFKSSDLGDSWTDCGVSWVTIIGGYEDRALGIKNDGGDFVHDEYPQPASFVSSKINSNFPVEDMSQMVMASNEWTSSQQAMITGGILADGTLNNIVWGYDGNRWGQISESNTQKSLPKLRLPVMLSYYTCTLSSSDYSLQKRTTWMVMGGLLENGNLNRTTYISYDQGIHWSKGESGVQLPSHMPGFFDAQAFTVVRTKNSSTSLHAYNPGHITPVTQWDVPYIYLFGGYGNGGVSLGYFWQGVLTGLTYKPVF